MYPTYSSRTIPTHPPLHAESAELLRRTSIVVVREPMTLSGFIPAWEELAAAALEPNVFYEHWMLLPAFEAFGAGRDICFALVLIRDPLDPEAPAKLIGLFPLELIPRVRRLQVPALSMWQHVHCLLGTPLIRADAFQECILELLLWLRSGEAHAPMIELKSMSGDGPFHRSLTDLLGDHGIMSWETDIYTRALLRKGRDPKSGFESVISSELRRTLRRKEARLSERGRVEHVVWRPGDDAGRWIDEFLRIEAGGKARRAGALEGSETYRRSFREMATAAFNRGRLLMLGINFDGRPIARGSALLAGEGSFAFTMAFDEEFARFSPGVMLELDIIRQLDKLPAVLWLDSGTDGDNALIGRLSNDQRTIHSLAVGGSAPGEILKFRPAVAEQAKRGPLKSSSTLR